MFRFETFVIAIADESLVQINDVRASSSFHVLMSCALVERSGQCLFPLLIPSTQTTVNRRSAKQTAQPVDATRCIAFGSNVSRGSSVNTNRNAANEGNFENHGAGVKNYYAELLDEGAYQQPELHGSDVLAAIGELRSVCLHHLIVRMSAPQGVSTVRAGNIAGEGDLLNSIAGSGKAGLGKEKAVDQ